MLAKERARAIKAKEKEFKRKEEEKENECDDERNNKSMCDNKTLEDGMMEVKTSLALVSAAVAKTATSAAKKKKRKRAIHVADYVQQ
jgi:hypothetical protein